MNRWTALLLFLFVTNITRAGTVECTQEFPGSVPLESGHRAYRFLAALQLKTSSVRTTPIHLCVWEDNTLSSQMESRHRNTATIAASRFTFTYFSDPALSGALAHELGHIVENARNPHPNARETEREDQVVDAFAIKLVGAGSLRATYLEHLHDKAMADRRISRALKLLQKGIE